MTSKAEGQHLQDRSGVPTMRSCAAIARQSLGGARSCANATVGSQRRALGTSLRAGSSPPATRMGPDGRSAAGGIRGGPARTVVNFPMIDTALASATRLLAGAFLGGALLLGAEILAAVNGHRLDPSASILLEPEPPGGSEASGASGWGGASDGSIVWLGDSTAIGYGASSAANGLPARLSVLLGHQVRPAVLARGGARIRDVVEHQLPRLSGSVPALVFISVGANDVMHLTRRKSFLRDYETLLSQLPPDAPVILLGVPDMGALPRLRQPLRAVAGWRSRSLDALVRDLAGARSGSCRHIDMGALAGPVVRRDPRRYLAADRYHPNDEGYALCAEMVAAALASAGHRGDGPDGSSQRHPRLRPSRRPRCAPRPGQRGAAGGTTTTVRSA